MFGENASFEMNTSLRQNYLKEGFKIAVVDDVIIVPLFHRNYLFLHLKILILNLEQI